MKSKILITISLLMAMMVNTQLFGQSVTSKDQKTKIDTFKVYGNCEMCKARIEKAALGVNGVKTAVWNDETKILKIESMGINILDIEKAIAKVGHDTDKIKAENKVYNSLPGCCKYRK